MEKILTHDEISLIKDGKILQAIKTVKERTGLGVEESKKLVDSEKKRRGL